MKYLYFLPGYFFLFLFLSVVSLAQNPRFDSYKILDNRKNVDVNTIHQGKKGFIWLGTEYGLVRFDGKEFQQYTTEDSLYENKISSVYQDEKGRMWIGHPSGKISFYTGKIFKKF